MSAVPREVTAVHIRLLKCMLEPEHSRAYWAHADGSAPVAVQRAFAEYWFGSRSLPRVALILANLRVRFDAFPAALGVLHHWADMPPDTRRLICHWHVQLADPLYRAFSGVYLPSRREGHRAEVTLPLVVTWVRECGPPQWQMATRIKFASNLLSTARAAGIVTGNRDPRPVVSPRVDDDALEYLLYLLRGVRFAGTLLENPYLRSVGLGGASLEDRARRLPALCVRRQGDLVDVEWRCRDLQHWAESTGKAPSGAASGGGR